MTEGLENSLNGVSLESNNKCSYQKVEGRESDPWGYKPRHTGATRS